MKTRIYDHITNDRMATGHWDVHHLPEEDRTGLFGASGTDEPDTDTDSDSDPN